MEELYIKRVGSKQILINSDRLYYHSGNSRDVYIGKKYVIKFSDSWNQSLNEFTNYLKIKYTEFEKYFCPILQFGELENKSYVIQPKLDLISYNKMKSFENFKNEIRYKLGLQDVHRHNWTVINDIPVIFDYGFEKFTKI